MFPIAGACFTFESEFLFLSFGLNQAAVPCNFIAGNTVVWMSFAKRCWVRSGNKLQGIHAAENIWSWRHCCWPRRFMCLVFLAQSIVSFLIDHHHLFRRRQEFPLFPCACTSRISCCSCDAPSFHSGNDYTIIFLTLLQENRQFGSKMTDSKYFTTTKKGLIAYYLLIHKLASMHSF